MKTNDLIEKNAELQEKLNEENSSYYSNLLIYVRSVALFRSEHDSEELLLGILQDILDAQNDGITAEEYFGKNPKQIADEMIKNLPIDWLEAIKTIFTYFSFFTLFFGLTSLMDESLKFDVGRYLILLVSITVSLRFVLWLIGYTTYKYKSRLRKFTLYSSMVLVFSAQILIILLVDTPLTITIGKVLGTIIILGILLILVYLFIKNKQKSLWVPFIPIVISAAVVGVLARVGLLESLLKSDKSKIIAILSITLFTALQYLIIFLYNRKKAKAQESAQHTHCS